jgi:hypothetical protein
MKTQAPNQYHVSGHGIAVSYYPDGQGPVFAGGPVCLVYQDAHWTLSFVKDRVRTASSDDLGLLVSVTIVETIDLGATTFSLLIPNIQLPAEEGASSAITTLGIKTVHRTFLGAIGQAQRETYTSDLLHGDARIGPLAE